MKISQNAANPWSFLPKWTAAILMTSCNNQSPIACSFDWWLVMIYLERKILLTGNNCLIFKKRIFLLIGELINHTNWAQSEGRCPASASGGQATCGAGRREDGTRSDGIARCFGRGARGGAVGRLGIRVAWPARAVGSGGRPVVRSDSRARVPGRPACDARFVPCSCSPCPGW